VNNIIRCNLRSNPESRCDDVQCACQIVSLNKPSDEVLRTIRRLLHSESDLRSFLIMLLEQPASPYEHYVKRHIKTINIKRGGVPNHWLFIDRVEFVFIIDIELEARNVNLNSFTDTIDEDTILIKWRAIVSARNDLGCNILTVYNEWAS